MAKNRRNQSAAIRFAPAIKALLLCLMIGGSGIGYVWQKSQLAELGRQIKKREVYLAELKGHNDRLGKGLETMQLPWFLKQRIEYLNLGLVPPQPMQIWRLNEPLPEMITGSTDAVRIVARQDWNTD